MAPHSRATTPHKGARDTPGRHNLKAPWKQRFPRHLLRGSPRIDTKLSHGGRFNTNMPNTTPQQKNAAPCSSALPTTSQPLDRGAQYGPAE
eukprot:4140031-Pyramimonas_sp.AAC.1